MTAQPSSPANKPAAQPQITKQAAAEYLSQQVYAPQFFGKLASLGIEPTNEIEAGQLLQLAVSLNGRGYKPQKVAKAQAGNPFLSHLLEKEAALQPVDPQILKQSSVSLLQADPNLLAAVRAIHAPEQPVANAA